MKEPTIHDIRAWSDTFGEGYLETLAKSVNPHNSPKETLQKLFPSAKVNILKGNVEIPENVEWMCNRGCDIEAPIITFELRESVVNGNLRVVTKIKCCPVLTCPSCLNQEVAIWEDK